MKKNILPILSFIMLSYSSMINAQEIEYRGITDPALKNAQEAFRATQLQQELYMFYTLNERVPGAMETAGLNFRDKEGNIQFRPFFRWLAGPFTETKSPLTVAIEASSRGFICVQVLTAEAYTRDGRFAIDSSGRLVTLSGSYIIKNDYGGGPIVIPPGADLSISRSGVVYADGEVVGKIKVNVFTNKGMDTLVALNGNFFVSSTGGVPDLVAPEEKQYSVLQGFIEESNVTKSIVGDIAYAKNATNSIAKAAKTLARIMSSAVQAAQP